jgi:hypothetical protein
MAFVVDHVHALADGYNDDARGGAETHDQRRIVAGKQ